MLVVGYSVEKDGSGEVTELVHWEASFWCTRVSTFNLSIVNPHRRKAGLSSEADILDKTEPVTLIMDSS